MIAQDKSAVKPAEIKMQHVGGIGAKFIVALISDGEGGAWIGSEDNTRLASEYYFDLTGNIIAQIIVPFDSKTLKPIADKKRVTRMEYDAGNRFTNIFSKNNSNFKKNKQNIYTLLNVLTRPNFPTTALLIFILNQIY
ncbi:MAG: hypothetical protein LBJ00_10265 [Planctomycetaceae bacterium]|nr:hypothetical protein [Planctomycetaceae bacterium]